MGIRLNDVTVLNIGQYVIEENSKTMTIDFKISTYEILKPIFPNTTLLSSIEVLGDSREVIILITEYTKLYSITIKDTLITIILKQPA